MWLSRVRCVSLSSSAVLCFPIVQLLLEEMQKCRRAVPNPRRAAKPFPSEERSIVRWALSFRLGIRHFDWLSGLATAQLALLLLERELDKIKGNLIS